MNEKGFGRENAEPERKPKSVKVDFLANAEARLLRLLQFSDTRSLERWLDSPEGHPLGCLCGRPCVTLEQWERDRREEAEAKP